MLDSIIKTDNKYYSQICLEECVYKQQKQKQQKQKNHIPEELKSESESHSDPSN